MTAMQYQAPYWLPGGQAQTIWPALFSRSRGGPELSFRRERWNTPDGDFVDVDWIDGADAEAPLLVLFHGLEGSSQSHYAQAFATIARSRGWAIAIPHFRGCSGELNLAPRAYHSGDFEEVGWMLEQCREAHEGPLIAAGVSLGGNALLRWAEEHGQSAAATARAVCSICSPVDLAAAGHAIGQGFNRLVYTRMFLRTMVPKALRKLAQHPGLFDGERLRQARDLYEFDNLFTAPLHGFRNTEDYWSRCSAKPHLKRIRIPALVLNARNDPFVPAASLPRAQDAGSYVTLWQPAHGGHVGFADGRLPGHVFSMPEQVCDWLGKAL
ncbi:YheT family hydrolase [Roseateles violae]|uniref:Alpha/beta fold hydrolase n=1 Tax=Roseateles violae TaxID=3058042 RepID=A0ABT8DST8_9BURK|nr:alpha/beta fold hydrolase [Pelomonas sp. PFR6]MDN3919412.1 alpha/beta fold hydrolase [Pelomonas sp. PFR6]